MADIINVVSERRLVQCHVRQSGTIKVLRLWAASDQAAEELVRALPQERTADFAQQRAEQSSFNAALASLGTRPLVTPALIVINCAVFAFTVYIGAGFLQADGSVLAKWGTNYGPLTLSGEPWRLFTSMFLHFGLLHLALNMWALWSMGQLTERLFGSTYFLVLYLFAGLCGSLASLYWHPNLNSAGASGAIFGVLGGLLAFSVNPGTRVPASVAAPQRNAAFVFILYNLFNGVAHAGIDNAAHVGGLVGGFAMGWALARPVDIQARQHPARRLSLSALAAAVLLIAMSWPLFHPSPTVAAERDFRKQFRIFAKEEDTLVTAERTVDALARSHKITDDEWGRRVARDIVPGWKAAEDQISLTDLPAQSSLFPLREALIAYLDQRKLALETLSDAARKNDSDQLAWGTELMQKNNARADEIRTLVGRVF